MGCETAAKVETLKKFRCWADEGPVKLHNSSCSAVLTTLSLEENKAHLCLLESLTFLTARFRGQTDVGSEV